MRARVNTLHCRHRYQEFLKFLKKIGKNVPAELDVHVVCDNFGTHKTPPCSLARQAPSLPHPLHPDRVVVDQPGGAAWAPAASTIAAISSGVLIPGQGCRSAVCLPPRGPWPSTRTSAHGSRTRTTTQGRSPGPRPQRTSWTRWPGTWPGSHPGLAKRQGTSIPDSRRISWPARRFRTAAARGPRSAGRAGRPGCRPCPHKERGPGHTAKPRSWPVSCRCSSPLSTASRAGR